jgi:exosortase
LLKAFVLCLALLLPFWRTWYNLVLEWQVWDQALGHGYFIGLATLYLIFSTAGMASRQNTSAAKAILGASAVVVFALLAALSQRVAMDAITQLALVGLLFGLVLAFFPGTTWLRAIQTSGLLLFGIQAWGSINGILLWLASDIVGSAISLLAIPALIDGNSITLPYGIMIIADGCSGLRYFVVSLALGWMLSISQNYSFTGMIMTLAVAAALALVMNWIRIYILILVGYYSEMQNALVNDHEFFGWVLFGVIIFPALYFAPNKTVRSRT